MIMKDGRVHVNPDGSKVSDKEYEKFISDCEMLYNYAQENSHCTRFKLIENHNFTYRINTRTNTKPERTLLRKIYLYYKIWVKRMNNNKT